MTDRRTDRVSVVGYTEVVYIQETVHHQMAYGGMGYIT